jgi:hypothetical protein
MSFTIDGTNGLTFNDATTQASTATNASNISSGTLGKARLPTGSVLQVVNATYATEVSTSTSTYIDTGLTASITPLFSTSKILVTAHQNGVDKRTGNTYIAIQLQRNGSNIIQMATVAAGTGTTAINDVGTVSIDYLDSPATTSSTTYKTQFNSNGNVAVAYVQKDSAASTITLMEIAA